MSESMNLIQLVGRCFVWEPTAPHATAQIVVVSVTYNADAEWWVETADIVTGKRSWNELTRFEEATKLSAFQIGELLRSADEADTKC